MRTTWILLLAAAAAAAGDPEKDALRRRVAELERAHLAHDIDAYLDAAEPHADHGHAPHAGLGAHLLVGAGASTATNDELEALQGGAHDPRRRGFTFQQLELSLVGDLHASLRGEAYVVLAIDPVDGETVVELEEAFLITARWRGRLEAEAGQMFTEFGLHNPRHPHEWDFVDQPVVHSRFFGGDGMRAPGVRAGWFGRRIEAHVGLQNAEGETMRSFLGEDEVVAGRAVSGQGVRDAGDLVALARVRLRGHDLAVGLSAVTGPNGTGASGRTTIVGADVSWRRGRFAFEAEVLARVYEAAAAPGLAADTFDDVGYVALALWRFRPDWRLGVRAGGVDAPSARRRWSLLVERTLTDAARLRFQVNREDGDVDAWSGWLVVELGFGEG